MDSHKNNITIKEYAGSVKKWLRENVKNDYCFAGRPHQEYCTVTDKFEYYYPVVYFRYESDLLAFRLRWGINE